MKKIIILLFIIMLSTLSCGREYDEPLKLFFVRTGNIYQLPGLDEKPILVLGGTTYNYPAISNDGKYLVCKSPTNSLIFNTSDFTLYKTLSATDAYTHSWSPDGTKIAASVNAGYVAVYDIKTGVQLWNAGGGGRTGHYFTSDGKRVTETNGVNFYEYLPEVDTTPERTRTLPGSYNNLRLSPDGMHIAADDGTNIVIIKEDTLTAQSITNGIQPAWSPDGNSIVFNRGGNLYICNVDGQNEIQLTFSGSDSFPCFQY